MSTQHRSIATRMIAVALLFAVAQTTFVQNSFATGIERKNAIVQAVSKTKDAIVTIKTIRISRGDAKKKP